MTAAPPTAPRFLRRIAALLIDYLLILAWMAVLGLGSLAVLFTTGSLPNWLAAGTAVAQLLGFVLLVLPVGVYLFACESGPRQATVGKRALGLAVVRARDAGRPQRWRILVRTVVKLIPWELAHFVVWQTVAWSTTGETRFPEPLLIGLVVVDLLPLVYVACVAFAPQRRGPHDWAAGTRVIDARASFR
ncbi:RDD family protein [Herbiconiux sp. L3-i23]|uniref:RDD family protein n=1 Tax=Herbiconiux sp. L3-i23 TaxID=2905871 RepID=UPI00205132A7|nr:RDD family protein [Herbiconiux sp. L3-i23]BDI22153.1 hypothetical protein L3i23_09290 [Herbiconiux sp. L3-i23]